MNKADVQECINMAIDGESKLTSEILELSNESKSGMTGKCVQHLLNNLCSRAQMYFEVGIFRGATFVSAKYQNDHVKAIGCDNWLQFNDLGDNRRIFLRRARKWIKNFTLIDGSCFEIQPKHLPNKIDLMFYDGAHSFDAQEMAVTHFEEMMADKTVLIVDDFNRWQAKNGTWSGIEKAGLHVVHHWNLSEGKEKFSRKTWWGGIGVFLLSKTDPSIPML